MPHFRASCLLTVVFLWAAASAAGQPFLSNLSAGADAALFATYAAPLERSEFIVDQAYHFRYYDRDRSVEFTTDAAGSLGVTFKAATVIQHAAVDAFERPIVTASYDDLARYRYRPFADLQVTAHFQVYSSRLALLDLALTNDGNAALEVDVYPYLRHRVREIVLSETADAILFRHTQQPDSWTRTHGVPYVEERRNVLVLDSRYDEAAAFPFFAAEEGQPSFLDAAAEDRLDGPPADSAGVVAFRKRVVLAPGETQHLRIVRGVDAARVDPAALIADARRLMGYDPDEGLRAAEQRYLRIPQIPFDDPAREATYWNAFSLLRQVMLPPEGRSSYNYYVFSREPTWGWGHGGQVFHESLAMLAYVYMDPESALNSQRVYMERQYVDGYINYRTGSYLDEIIPTDGVLTTSAPWYNWINWELFRQTSDEEFLGDAYASGTAFYEWWLRNRDADGDGLAEWGGHAVLENVRDGYVAVWDEVGWPSNFEAVDLNSMLVVEARSLASMAEVLGRTDDAERWRREAVRRADAINETFWDDDTGFYYHVDREDHDFSFEAPDDLKRREIVGFLPLWAGVASEDQAARLIEHMTDPDAFWRPYGVPTLAADDPYYDPMGYWNGPIWVEWQYLLFRGLLDYGRTAEARELADRVLTNVTHHLTDSHTFWELYSPDALEAGHHQTYIWTGLVARMMLDLHELGDR